MRSFVAFIEEAIRDCRGSLSPETLAAVSERADEEIRTGAFLESADVAYLAGLLREIGLSDEARKVVGGGIRQAGDRLQYSRLQNLQGRLAFEARRYSSAVSSFEEAFITAARIAREHSGTADDRAADAIQLRCSAAFNLVAAYERLGDFDQSKVWRRRLDQYRASLGAAAVTAAVMSISTYWRDSTQEDRTPTAEIVAQLQTAATIIVKAVGPDHHDAVYSLMTIAAASCELALYRGNIEEASDLAALMNAMVQKAGISDHSQDLYRWLRLVSLSSDAEVAIAAGQWDFLRETANSFEGLIRSWSSEGDYYPALSQVLRLNLAAVNIELARESAHRKTLTEAISSLRQAIDASKRHFSPVDARISIATTSYALALADANWDNPYADLQDVADEVSAALDLAVTTFGREHPGSLILARQLQALRERLHPEPEEFAVARSSTATVIRGGTITGGSARGGYVSWQQAASAIIRERHQLHRRPRVAVNGIGSEEAFLAAIDETIKYFNDGDIVEGTVVKVDRDEVLLDIGYKTEGVIPSRELSIKHDVDPHDVVKTGEHIEALVLQKEDKEGRLILSKKRAQYERAWGTIEKIKEEDGVVTGTVIEVVKGGLILDIGLRGFLPASLVEMRRVRDLQPYVGKEIEAKIIELDKNRNNVVLSRRAWLEQTQSEVRHTFLNTLSKGQIRKGVVSSIVNFGAFVDLGGVDGLVHVSELSWKHIDHPGEVVEVGQEVTVEVLDVDMDRERVSLSLKSTQEDPWQQFARTHQIGQVVPGRVTKLVPFGAFVRVEEGIEGLVHISELADRHVEIPEQVVQV